MMIDIHSHIFPEKVALKAIPKLADIIQIEPSMDGTYQGLLTSMENAGIDISVVLPAVTDPHQYPSVTRFALKINEEFYCHPTHGILSFGGIHPDCDNINDKLKELKHEGFAGIKLHPDYQGVLFNDIRYKRILDKASELDLTVITHTGYDVYSPDLIHCTTRMITEVLDEVAPTRLILAHMGNNCFYDDVERDLLGRDVYFDTAYTISNIPPQKLLNLIQKHGTDKILFGTDAPWSNQTQDKKTIESLGLSQEDLDKITHKTAQKLLNLL